mgnify:FL=1
MDAYTVMIHSTGVDAVDIHEDEYAIAASTPQSAIATARRRFASDWPSLTIDDAFVLPGGIDPNLFDLELDAIR